MYTVIKETTYQLTTGYATMRTLVGTFNDMDDAYNFSEYLGIKNTDMDIAYYVISQWNRN